MSSRSLSALARYSTLRIRPNPIISRRPAQLRHRLLSTLPNLPLFRALQSHDPSSLAVIHSTSSRSFTYGSLIADVVRARNELERKVGNEGGHGQLTGERVAFLAENSYDYVGTVSLFFLTAMDHFNKGPC